MSAILSIRRCRVELHDGQHRRFVLSLDGLSCSGGIPTAVIGPSGSGKSTLLELLALVRRPSTADGFYFSTGDTKPATIDIAKLWIDNRESTFRRLRARSIGYAPQRGGYFPALSVQDNAVMRANIAGLPRMPAVARFLALANALEFSKRETKAMPRTLSAGQRQRLALLQALIHHPRLIVADEPTSSLHPTLAQAIFDFLRDHAARTGAQLIVATHEADRARDAGFCFLEATTDRQDSQVHTTFSAI